MALQNNDFAFLLPEFPFLQDSGFQVTSNPDQLYNCIAWAANDTSKWWWPDEDGDGYWPETVPRQETLEAFISAYATLGYVSCDNGEPEQG